MSGKKWPQQALGKANPVESSAKMMCCFAFSRVAKSMPAKCPCPIIQNQKQLMQQNSAICPRPENLAMAATGSGNKPGNRQNGPLVDRGEARARVRSKS